MSSVRKTNSAAIAAEVRGFNLRTRESGFKEYPFAGIDFAALAVAVAEGRDPEWALRFANAAAALSVTRLGAAVSAPTRDEILSMMAAQYGCS